MARRCSITSPARGRIRRGIVQIGQDLPAPDFGRPHPGLPAEPIPRPYAADNE